MKLVEKVKALSQTPGVYLFKNRSGEIIYVGKAARLRARVSQYFSASNSDSRMMILDLVSETTDLKTIDTPSEMEALFLESELIKRYQPKYNSDWKDERNFLYVRINFVFSYPPVEFVRRPLADKATYIGPFIDSTSLKKSLRYLRKIFPYSIHKPSGLGRGVTARSEQSSASRGVLPAGSHERVASARGRTLLAQTSGPQASRACLDYHIGLCPGPEIGAISSPDYKKNLHKLISVIRGKTGIVEADIRREMKKSSIEKNFERAAVLRDKIKALENLSYKKVFALSEKYEGLADEGLTELARVLKIDSSLERIEAFDISNFSGKEAVGSMVVFIKGVPKRDEYKRFRIKYVKGIDDFKMMQEVLRRRLNNNWPVPDLILIDGGKGQLSAARAVINTPEREIPAIGLAKRIEEIVTVGRNELLNTNTFKIIHLSHRNPALKLLQRIRDEAHRFAVLYHTELRAKKMTRSFLDEIAGIGPETKKKLILHFGSASAIKLADAKELSRVAGKQKAQLILSSLGLTRGSDSRFGGNDGS